jgi:NADPH-dependent ferric siderophore reductase
MSDFPDLAVAVPSRPAGDLDDQQLLVKARGSSRWDLTVEDVAQIAPRMLRITASAPGLEAMEWQPAQDITLRITRAAGRDIRRRYTIAGQDHDRIHLDVYLHGQGIGTVWAQNLRRGDTVSGIGPRGKLLVDEGADWHVMIGDETSLPGIRAMLAATESPTHVVVEVDDPDEWHGLGVDGRCSTEWTWLTRGRSQGVSDVVLRSGAGTGHAYVSGEAQQVLAWRDQLERGGLDPSAISHKAYWGVGRANATHGEPLI